MVYLWVVSVIWALSFGLIKGQLTGLPATYVTLIRMVLACIVFLPFFRVKTFKASTLLKLFVLGAFQFGCMYILYIQSYQYLKGHEIALFTITTPFFVTLIHDVFEKKFHGWAMLMVLVCIAGSIVIKYSEINRADFWWGFCLIQLANLCFALGQVGYKKLFEGRDLDQKQAFAPMFFGAIVVASLAIVASGTQYVAPTSKQWFVLFYLGILSSGVCFFLWNVGATQVKGGVLAIMNNMKIPLAILASVLFFGESTNLTTLVIGTALILLALWGVDERVIISKKGTLGLGALTLVGFFLSRGMHYNYKRFNSERWKSWVESEAECCLRWDMVRSLQARHELNGMSKIKVIELLGEPKSRTKEQFRYFLGSSRRGMSEGSLVINFGIDNAVTSYLVWDG